MTGLPALRCQPGVGLCGGAVPWEDEPADAPPGSTPASRPAAGPARGYQPGRGRGLAGALGAAAGWLAHQHRAWVHPTDLGLRDAGLTGSVTAASLRGRLPAALPTTPAARPAPEAGTPPDVLADDAAVAQALRLARLWRRLAEQRSWTPLADTTAVRALLAHLGDHAPAEHALMDWRSGASPLGRPRPA